MVLMIRRNTTTFVLLAAVATGMQSCGSDNSTAQDPGALQTENTTGADCVDPSIMQSAVYDYEPSDPVELALKPWVDLVITGAVQRVVEGPWLPDPGEDPIPYVLLDIEVAGTPIARDVSRVYDGHVYLLARQGPLDADTKEPIHDLEDWNERIPAGTKVAAFLGEGNRGMENALTGKWADPMPLATNSQGLIMETCGQLVGAFDHLAGEAWTRYDSVSDLVAPLPKATESVER